MASEPTDSQATSGLPTGGPPTGPLTNPLPTRPERPSPTRAYCFVGVVVLGALAVLAGSIDVLSAAWRPILIWVIVNLMAESLWLPTVTGRATSSMASAVNFATLFILSPAAAVWSIAIAAGLATALIQRRSWLKSVFNFAQMALAVAVAGWFYTQTGGGAVTLDALRNPAILVPFLNAGVVYFLVNTALVATVVGMWEGQSILSVWRENYGYADDLLTSLTLFLLSPLVVMAYLAVGLVGLILCFLPMLLVRNAAGRQIELQRTQEAMLWNARMAAMGEMAAEIGHELGNVLQVISAQAQILLTDVSGVRGERAQRSVRQIFERAVDIRRMAQGLMDFSHREVVPRHQQLSRIVRETVEMVQPQNRFDGIDWNLELIDDDPPMQIDAGQLRQVLVNLYRNAAEAMQGQAERRIAVAMTHHGERVMIVVADNGPGIPDELVERIFEPWMTTKPDGHGFGLAVSYRIVSNHGGRIWAENRPEGGTAVIIELPTHGARDRRRAA